MIAFLINELNVRGGTHKQLLRLVEYADSKNIEFVIITKVLDYSKTYPEFLKYKEKTSLINYGDTSNLFYKIYNVIKGIFFLRKKTRFIDTINIHDNGFSEYMLAFWGKKVYWQINDLPYCFGEGTAKDTKSTFNIILKKFLIKIMTKLIVTDVIVNVTKNKYRVEKNLKRSAYVFYCGIEVLNIEKNIHDSIFRFQNKSINLLTTGVFVPYRNYETQIKVVKLLKEKGFNVTLNIIGSTLLDKNYATKISEIILKERLEKEIIINGQVDENKFKELHKNADIFLFINVDQSWGLAVFEAMSCGLPVIVSESVGAVEILNDNVNAFFVSPYDVLSITDNIISLVSNSNLYLNISNNSKEYVKKYTWENTYCIKMINLMMNNN